ncbi:hypothetical protein SDC9_99838 [bioreactor metagenome]|uniref:Uncharacterized protein n=1 Tax=bioreactor metagenome TaxID=1076179 RepID=A0A645AU19_9ZZZZ
MRHVARTGHGNAQAVKAAATGLEHFIGEVDRAVAGGFGADQRAAEGQALAGEHGSGAVGQLLVHAGHEAHFAAAHADVASGHVGVGAHVTEQLGHEGLAEAHDFSGALALGVEVRAALAAAHGQRGQRVLEGLFESQELQHRQVHRGVEAQAALEWTDGHAVLDAEAAVDLNVAMVVGPGHAEHHHAFRLDEALEQALLGVARVLFDEGPQALHHFRDGLQELWLTGIALGDLLEELPDGCVLHKAEPSILVTTCFWNTAEIMSKRHGAMHQNGRYAPTKVGFH